MGSMQNNAPGQAPASFQGRKIHEIRFSPTIRQKQAWDILQDTETTELLFGGASGGGKSHLACVWLVFSCLRYPGSRWLMGRAVLKRLKDSTLLTFFQICKEWNLKPNEDYNYNSIEGIIKFFNDSTIYLKDLFLYPSDPEFDSLGLTEFCGAVIDEASEITIKAKNILMSRLRFKLEKFNLIPKLLICSNPSKNFLYYDFYKPWKENKLPAYRKFLPAFVKDNPYISPHHLENLKKLDKVSKERLLYGNWEYDDDPTKLFNYDSIVDLFTNEAERGQKYCTVDVAGRGRDKTVLTFWDGLFITNIKVMENISSEELDTILIENRIQRSHCLVDEDGVGFGLVKDLSGVQGFVNNARPFKSKEEKETSLQNFRNLKAQCWFELANYVNSGRMGIYRNIDAKIKEKIIEDLEQIKQSNPGKDQPLSILTKEEIKENLGRSTDYGDSIFMRMFFVLQRPNKLFDLDDIRKAMR